MDKVLDFCTSCMKEVYLEPIPKEQICPNCGETVIPCWSSCNFREECNKDVCPAVKYKNKL